MMQQLHAWLSLCIGTAWVAISVYRNSMAWLSLWTEWVAISVYRNSMACLSLWTEWVGGWGLFTSSLHCSFGSLSFQTWLEDYCTEWKCCGKIKPCLRAMTVTPIQPHTHTHTHTDTHTLNTFSFFVLASGAEYTEAPSSLGCDGTALLVSCVSPSDSWPVSGAQSLTRPSCC